MTTQRQLELSLNAVARSFRQALRHALKTDPHGNRETSQAWATVVQRQVMLERLAATIANYLHPQPQAAPTEAPAPENEAPTETQPDRTPAPTADPNVLTLDQLPPELEKIQRKIEATLARPITTDREERRREIDLSRLRQVLHTQARSWARREERAAAA